MSEQSTPDVLSALHREISLAAGIETATSGISPYIKVPPSVTSADLEAVVCMIQAYREEHRTSIDAVMTRLSLNQADESGIEFLKTDLKSSLEHIDTQLLTLTRSMHDRIDELWRKTQIAIQALIKLQTSTKGNETPAQTPGVATNDEIMRLLKSVTGASIVRRPHENIFFGVVIVLLLINAFMLLWLQVYRPG